MSKKSKDAFSHPAKELCPSALPPKQAALYSGISKSFLAQDRHDKLNGRKNGRTSGPPFVKIGRKVLYRVEDLDAWLQAHLSGGVA